MENKGYKEGTEKKRPRRILRAASVAVDNDAIPLSNQSR